VALQGVAVGGFQFAFNLGMLLILLCIQVECYDPRPRGEPVDTFAVGLEGSQGVAQLIFDGIQAVENAVVEGLLPEFAPQIFHGIELWGIGWQGQQGHVLGHLERLGAVPACAVEHHRDKLAGVAGGNLVEENIHALGARLGENQGVQAVIPRAEGGVGIAVFPYQRGAHVGTHPGRPPTPARIADPTEAALVLKHQSERASLGPLPGERRQRCGEFFFQASCCAGSPLG